MYCTQIRTKSMDVVTTLLQQRICRYRLQMLPGVLQDHWKELLGRTK